MPTHEEIKKIAREYAESANPDKTYDTLSDSEKKLRDFGIEQVYIPLLEWLSKDYCIVPKSKVKNCYGMARNIKLANTVSQHIVEDDYQQGVMDVLQSIFGTSLFNE